MRLTAFGFAAQPEGCERSQESPCFSRRIVCPDFRLKISSAVIFEASGPRTRRLISLKESSEEKRGSMYKINAKSAAFRRIKASVILVRTEWKRLRFSGGESNKQGDRARRRRQAATRA